MRPSSLLSESVFCLLYAKDKAQYAAYIHPQIILRIEPECV